MGCLGFERQVALRFLREGRMQTLLIIVGVTAGVAVIAHISALISGLQASTLKKTLGAQPHISVQAPDDVVTSAALRAQGAAVLSEAQVRSQRLRTVAKWQALIPVLERLPGVAAVSPVVSGAGLALRGEASQAISLQGVDLERYDRIVGLRSKVVSGTARLAPGEAIAGRELAADLALRVGDWLRVQTTGSNEVVQVTALVDLGIKELNWRTVIVLLRSAQNLLGLPGGATNMDLTVCDVWAAQAIGEQLRRELPHQLETWQESNAQLVSALNAQSVSTSLILAVVLVVLVLGIASVFCGVLAAIAPARRAAAMDPAQAIRL